MLLSRPQDPSRLGAMKPGPLRQPRLFNPTVQDAMEVENDNDMDPISVVDERLSTRAHHTGIFFNNKELGPSACRKTTSTPRMDAELTTTEDCLDFSNPVPPKQELEATPMPDIAFSNPACTPENDVTTLSKAMGDWKPFVNRVAKFIEQERFPFEYVDIWIADKDDNNNTKEGSTSVLKHVGHATNSSTEISSIFTMYHMNQFGDNSEKYVFPPGVGLPGRVLVRGQPIWDEKLSNAATYSDFPRTALARKHGVRKGLGIPLALPDTGTSSSTRQAIIVMYTTQDNAVAQDSQGWLIHMMCQEFQRNKRSLASSSLSLRSASNTGGACAAVALHNKRQQPQALEEDPDDDDDHHYKAILPTDTEVEVAGILRTYAENQQHPQQQSAESLNTIYTLHALLIRAPCRRSLEENVRVDSLTGQFRDFKTERESEGQDNDNDSLLADMIVSAWEDVCWEEGATSNGVEIEEIDMSSTLGGTAGSGVEIEEIDMEEMDELETKEAEAAIIELLD